MTAAGIENLKFFYKLFKDFLTSKYFGFKLTELYKQVCVRTIKCKINHTFPKSLFKYSTPELRENMGKYSNKIY